MNKIVRGIKTFYDQYANTKVKDGGKLHLPILQLNNKKIKNK